MPFDPQKDKILKKWKCEQTGLVVTINQYDQGEPKLQIGPRVITKRDGGEIQRKAGRLTIEDVLWFYDIIDEAKDELARLARPQ
ncbi:MAG: hypothetical protein JRH18_07370 [Deltaproteobacteria bacterium]|nr:hypothetical protein [Deltaproteobacteria bacterium]MBW2151473.1 hypothetical protein [Deltaproteobacteria bacterium]